MPTDPPQVFPAPKTTAVMRRSTLALATALLVAGLIAFRYRNYDPTRWTYRYHQRELAAIVAQIKAQPMPISRSRTFQVARSLDPTSVRRYQQGVNEDLIDKICVYREDKDNYLIAIVIDDQGHAGTYGLLYADSPPETTPIPGSEDRRAGSPLLNILKARLGTKWWYVFADG
jgi:hypothetical protein